MGATSSLPSSSACPLCSQAYDSEGRAARSLPCSHKACTTCLLEMKEKGPLLCPFDGKECNVAVLDLPLAPVETEGTQGEEAATNSTATATASDAAAAAHPAAGDKKDAEKPAPRAAVCAEHHEPFCAVDLDTSQLVCKACLSQSQKGRRCKPVEVVAKEVRAGWEEKIPVWTDRMDMLREMSAKARDDLTSLDANKGECEDDIKAAFQDLRSLLAAREAELLEEVSAIHESKAASITAHLETVQVLTDSLERAMDDARKATALDDIAAIQTKENLDVRTVETSAVLPMSESPTLELDMVREDELRQAISAVGFIVQKGPLAPIQGVLQRVWGTAKELPKPSSIAIHNNEVFVADESDHSIMIYSKDGEYRRMIVTKTEEELGQEEEDDTTLGIAISTKTNELFFSDWVKSSIQVFSTESGELLRAFDVQDVGCRSQPRPSAIALNPQATELYVCVNGSVHVYSPLDGALLRKWGEEGEWGMEKGHFRFLSGIAVSANGEFVCVAEFGDVGADDVPHRVQVFSSSGRLLRVFGDTPGRQDGQFFFPEGMAFTSPTTMLLCDCHNDRVLELDIVEGTVVNQWAVSSYSPGDEQLRGPCAVAISEEGEAFVCGRFGSSVQVFA